MKTKLLFLSSFSLMLLGFPSCKQITVKNMEVCAIAGVMSAGMNCANTLSPETREMSLEETIKFLEPQEAVFNDNGKELQGERGPAMCMASTDFNTLKTNLEVACEELGRYCTYEMKETIQKMATTLDALQKPEGAKRGGSMVIINSVPSLNSSGKDVIKLQQQLLRKGYNPGSTDGIFGMKTLKAIVEFQKAQGLKPAEPGNLGPKTLKLLGLEVDAINPVTEQASITQDLKGKKDRHLHPNKRLEFENFTYVNGKWPQCFIDRDVQACYAFLLTKMAERGWKEVGRNNKGDDIGEIQGTTGSFTVGGNGDAWCLDYGQMPIAFMEDVFEKESPVPATAHCMTCLAGASNVPGLVAAKPEAGTLGLAKHGKGAELKGAGHALPTIRVNADGTMETCEGNTSISSIRDGDASGLKKRNWYVNGDLHTLGWVRIYPNNKLPS